MDAFNELNAQKEAAQKAASNDARDYSTDVLMPGTTPRKHQSIGAQIGWRGALAAGNAKFRIKGAYDAPASSSAARRYLARQIEKQMRKARKKEGK